MLQVFVLKTVVVEGTLAGMEAKRRMKTCTTLRGEANKTTTEMKFSFPNIAVYYLKQTKVNGVYKNNVCMMFKCSMSYTIYDVTVFW